MTTQQIARYEITLSATEMIETAKAVEHINDTVEYAGRNALARLLRRFADQLELGNSEIFLLGRKNELNFGVEEDGFNAKFILTFDRVE